MPIHHKGRYTPLICCDALQGQVAQHNLSFDIDPRGVGGRKEKKYFLLVTVESPPAAVGLHSLAPLPP